jgi:hypothetical protein
VPLPTVVHKEGLRPTAELPGVLGLLKPDWMIMSAMNVAEDLRRLRARKELVRAADLGFVCQLRCAMPVCFHPDASPPKGYYPLPNPTAPGRMLFEENDGRNPWAPTADHYPLLEYQGGTLIPENIRLAHKLCNSEDYWRSPLHADIRAERFKASLLTAQRRAVELNPDLPPEELA